MDMSLPVRQLYKPHTMSDTLILIRIPLQEH